MHIYTPGGKKTQNMFRSYNKSIFNTLHFDGNPLTVILMRKEKGFNGFRIGIFIVRFQVTAGQAGQLKGLRAKRFA